MFKKYKNYFEKKSSFLKGLFLAACFFALFLFLPARSFALDVLNIVPCENNCDFCQFYVLAANIFRFMLHAATFLAILYVAWGGFLILTSGVNTGNLSKGKTAVWNAVLGLIIAFTSWIIVNTFINFLVNPKVLPTPTWSEPECN